MIRRLKRFWIVNLIDLELVLILYLLLGLLLQLCV